MGERPLAYCWLVERSCVAAGEFMVIAAVTQDRSPALPMKQEAPETSHVRRVRIELTMSQ